MSKNDFILEAQPRGDVGKGASRRLRRNAGEIPAIIYGGGEDPMPVTLQHKDIAHATENEAFFSHIITLKVDGQEVSAIIKDLQRHPAKPKIMHADFMRIRADQEITVRVPLHFVNEEKAIGVKQEGGIINHMMNELEVTCLPGKLPEYIEVYMAELRIGDSIHIADLAMPEGVESVDLAHGENHPVAACVMPKEEVIEEPEDEEVAEGEEGDAEEAADDDDAGGDDGDDKADE
ncbi:MAG: 50S ribosomal protein L25/general stress protein Ctc [Gammaproteobacteria bacterium]|nr:50S ribosomal protein L25/general stress protein Ctc [Gammaproteobacteria bacterium]MAY03368.1 50S ribosomal protein L25/general stress protein Ctc [Gammaproteobacteria bacterium]|tara:strand:+ start:154 stop:855 length:702 start_codon:yes stop_codon:yes gene_type:complete